jgi:protein SHQ1
MLTPKFEITQSDTHLQFLLHVPFIRAQNIDIVVEEATFKILAKPYFLNLTLPGQVSSDEADQQASLDISTGKLSISIKKVHSGVDFPDLDLLTSLCKPKTMPNPVSTVHMLPDEGEEGVDEEDVEIDWSWQPEPENEETASLHYGFNQLYQGYESHIHTLAHEVLDIEAGSLDATSNTERNDMRKERENAAFNPDHYMHDFIRAADFNEILSYKPESHQILKLLQTSKISGEPIVFTDTEKEAMLALSNRDYLLTGNDARAVCTGLVDILFAYSYDHRVNLGESNVESGWNVAKISSTLCCFLNHWSLKDVVITNFRYPTHIPMLTIPSRSLTYPLYRNFELAQKCVRDVVILLKLGKKACLRALLKIREILQRDEILYILTRLYLDDYCVWIQKARCAFYFFNLR